MSYGLGSGGQRRLGHDVGDRVELADLAPLYSVNQRLPSGPTVMPVGPRTALAWGTKLKALVVGLNIPIAPVWLPLFRANQMLPSGPAVIPQG